MAIDIRKLNLPSLTRAEVTDLTSKTSFPNDLEGVHREGLLAYDYLPAEKGKGKKGKDLSACFQAKVKILESTAPMAAGRTYTLRFWLGGDYQHYSDRDRRAFLAALEGFSVQDFEDRCEGDPSEAYLDLQQTLMEFSEKGSLVPKKGEEPETQFIHTTQARRKQRAIIKDGKPDIEEYTVRQDTFAPLE